MQIDILYEDNDLLMVNKPAGLLMIPDRFNAEIPSLGRAIEAQIGKGVWIVHRLDRETSGVVCFALNATTHRYLSMLFEDRKVMKYYTGIVNGALNPKQGQIEKPIMEHPTLKGKMVVNNRGKASVTEYEVLEQWPLYSLVKFRIHTGRTHQIRVHTQSIGHSLICDPMYGDGKPFLVSSIKRKYKLSEKEENEKPLLNRVALHASSIQFDKEDGTTIHIEAPLPKDIAAVVKQLNKWQAATN